MLNATRILTAPEWPPLPDAPPPLLTPSLQTNRVLTEDRVLREVDHPLLALCYGTISTQKDIHYLLKQCEGGDLYQLLNSQGALKEVSPPSPPLPRPGDLPALIHRSCQLPSET